MQYREMSMDGARTLRPPLVQLRAATAPLLIFCSITICHCSKKPFRFPRRKMNYKEEESEKPRFAASPAPWYSVAIVLYSGGAEATKSCAKQPLNANDGHGS